MSVYSKRTVVVPKTGVGTGAGAAAAGEVPPVQPFGYTPLSDRPGAGRLPGGEGHGKRMRVGAFAPTLSGAAYKRASPMKIRNITITASSTAKPHRAPLRQAL